MDNDKSQDYEHFEAASRLQKKEHGISNMYILFQIISWSWIERRSGTM